jgi:hypothetical protein
MEGTGDSWAKLTVAGLEMGNLVSVAHEDDGVEAAAAAAASINEENGDGGLGDDDDDPTLDVKDKIQGVLQVYNLGKRMQNEIRSHVRQALAVYRDAFANKKPMSFIAKELAKIRLFPIILYLVYHCFNDNEKEKLEGMCQHDYPDRFVDQVLDERKKLTFRGKCIKSGIPPQPLPASCSYKISGADLVAILVQSMKGTLTRKKM